MSPPARESTRPWLRFLVGAALLVTAHALLAWLLDGRDFMGSLADARRGHYGWAALAGIFLVVRLVTFVLLPGMIVARAGLEIYDRTRRAPPG